MLSVNTEVHLSWKVTVEAITINSLLPLLRAGRAQSYAGSLAPLLEEIQERHFAQVLCAEAEIVCSGCGIVHCGAATLVRRGWRRRRLISCEGALRFRLRQLTCGFCGKTFSPYAELLGLAPRQRLLPEVAERLVAGVLHLSYARTCALARDWLGTSCSAKTLHAVVQQKGASLEFTPDPEARVLLADGTKCPIGTKAQDQEPALRAYVRDVYPEARHQLCEWHVGYTLDWSLIEDQVPAAQRRRIRTLLEKILFAQHSRRSKRRSYTRLVRVLGSISPTAQKQLQAAAGLILYEVASEERTTSLLERQMREINRRMENGARWSERGAQHLLGPCLARTHNPDDYARLWTLN